MRVQYIIVSFILLLFVLVVVLSILGYTLPGWDVVLNLVKGSGGV